MQGLEERTLRSRTVDAFERYVDLLDGLEQPHLRLPLDGGWTVSALLAHLSFWDRWTEARWDRFDRDGGFEHLPDSVLDLVNDSAMPAWLSVPARDAVELARVAATSVTQRIEGLALESLRAAIESGRAAMVDRSVHWTPHLDEIRRAVSQQPSAAQPAPPPAPRG
jgi:hypothetical protein